MSILRDIVKAGVIVVTLIDGQIYTRENIDDPMKLIMGLLIYIRANEESARKSDFSNANWKQLRQRASGGRVMSSNTVSWLKVVGDGPLGKDNRRFVLIEDKAKTVRTIVEMFLGGKGCQSIARALNDANVPMLGKGKMWHPRSVHSILTNPAIVGRYVMGEKARQEKEPPIEEYYPAICSADEFARICLMLGNGNVKARSKVANPLAAICVCSRCGAKMTRDVNLQKGRTYEKLICSAAKVGRCKGSYKSIDLAHVFDQVKAIVLSEKLFDDEVGANKLSQLKIRQAAAEVAISQTLELLFLQGHSKALGDRLAAVEAEKAEIDVAIDIEAGKAVLSGAKAMNDRLRDLKAAISTDDVAKVNGLLRSLFAKIVVDPFTASVEAFWQGA